MGENAIFFFLGNILSYAEMWVLKMWASYQLFIER